MERTYNNYVLSWQRRRQTMEGENRSVLSVAPEKHKGKARDTVRHCISFMAYSLMVWPLV